MSAPPALFRGLAIRSPMLRRFVAWTVATPAGLLAGAWMIRQVFAPEPAPADFATAGGGLLALRSRNVYASSSDMMAAMGLRDEDESITRRYGTLQMPVGILFARSDPILDYREHGEAMKRELPSLDLEIVDGGHMLPITQPDAVARFIRRMAAKVGEPAAKSALSP